MVRPLLQQAFFSGGGFKMAMVRMAMKWGKKCSFLSKKAGEFMMKDGESGSYFIQPVCFLEIKRTERRFGVSIVDL